ncbi:MAG TPA: hypothetical protein V6D20_09280, partial [Candidatus Obscuribacterales bacterium]
IRLMLNPFKPVRLPYMAVPYEHNPYSFFGIGVAENMDDSQLLMNGFMRMAVDNGKLAGNMLIEVDETNLVPGQDFTIKAGKVFRRQGGAPGQAIFGTKFPNTANENIMMFKEARSLADEATGIQSVSHGQAMGGIGRTASGMSMLMNAGGLSNKTVVKNVDDYLLVPLGRGYFQFNMQFDYDPTIKGDLEVRARGTESLMANEVRSQRLMQFIGIGSNPALAPFVKFGYIIREIARAMQLDPDKVTNNEAEAIRQALLLQQMGGMLKPVQTQGTDPNGAGGNGAAGMGLDPNDTAGTGGGNIGTGSVPMPQEEGFTGNGGQGAPLPPQAAG